MTQVDHPSLLENDGYVVVSNILSKDICMIATQHTLFRMVNHFSPDNYQVVGAHSEYSDTMMESILLFLKPKIEELTGKRLIPTYSFYRIYNEGDKLEDHTDRPSCEYSVSLTLGYRYNGLSNCYKWPLHFYKGNRMIDVCSGEGDGVIYKGCELVHGRKTLKSGDGSYHVQLFLHYVDADGPYAEKYKYDQREIIGIKKEGQL